MLASQKGTFENCVAHGYSPSKYGRDRDRDRDSRQERETGTTWINLKTLSMQYKLQVGVPLLICPWLAKPNIQSTVVPYNFT
jgi:hypothetical protein